MKYIFALIVFFSFAFADEWQACHNIGLFLDQTNEQATLELAYATSGDNAGLEDAVRLVFMEYVPAQEPNTILFGQYAIAVYPSTDGKIYAIAITALSETSFILCGYELEEVSSSGVES